MLNDKVFGLRSIVFTKTLTDTEHFGLYKCQDGIFAPTLDAVTYLMIDHCLKSI